MFLIFSAIGAILCVAIILQKLSYDRALEQRSQEIIQRVERKEKQLDVFYTHMKKELHIEHKR